MSVVLKCCFDFEMVFLIMDFVQELELVVSVLVCLLVYSGILYKVFDVVLELLVCIFCDLCVNGEKKMLMDILIVIMFIVEVVNVVYVVGVCVWFLVNCVGEFVDLVECIVGIIVKDNEEDCVCLCCYFE